MRSEYRPAESVAVRHGRLPLIVVLIACAGVVAGIVVLQRSGGSDSLDGGPSTARDSQVYAPSVEAFHFESVQDMSSAADLVVEGSVSDVRPGRRIEEEPGHVVEYEEAVIRVGNMITSAAGDAPSTVVLEQQVRSGGQPVIVAGRDPVVKGEEVLVFLKRVDPSLNASGNVTYVVINDQALYRVKADGSLDGPDTGDPLVAEIESLGASALEAQLP